MMISETISALNTNSFYDFTIITYIIIAESSVVFNHIPLLYQKSKIIKFIDRLESIVNTRITKYPVVKNIYTTANRNIENWSVYAIKNTTAFCVFFIVPYYLYSAWIILLEKHSIDELTLVYPLA